MRRGLLSLLIAIFFGALLLFISANYSPFENDGLNNIIQRYGITEEEELLEVIKRSIELGIVWEFLDAEILTAWILIMAGFVISLFTSIHLFIDKLFFRSILESPRLRPAIRRGIMLYFLIFAFAGLRLMGALEWYTIMITGVLLATVEVVFNTNIKKKAKE
ncbi:hypothetical protein KC675_01175 [Candidatus Dojkabacteria bacterium]|uniref:Uncharacterized protein n=1 Tax=Candidatus Dojkabacteria bacterium TaxID=2099670 RepID=A0A955I6P8_9BACT|nr:hypothetical protein [Candidatus Dojkabacteria bacterium]